MTPRITGCSAAHVLVFRRDFLDYKIECVVAGRFSFGRGTESCPTGVVAALFVTGATTVFVIFKLSDVSALIDAALFALIAWRIWKMSRAWAVIGLALFAVEKAYWIYVCGPKGLVMSVIILLAFVTSVREHSHTLG